MAKLTLTPITSGYASVAQLNNNFTAITAAFENTLSRDGTTPNQMGADLDMNNHSLLNVDSINGLEASALADLSTVLAECQTIYDNFDDRYLGVKAVAPTVDNDGDVLTQGSLYFNSVDKNMYVWTGTVWRKFNELSVLREEIIATSGQTVFTLSTLTYTPGVNGLFVYVDGVRQFDSAFTEDSSTQFTLSEGVPAGTVVLAESGAYSAGLLLNNASAVSFTPTGDISAGDVQAALTELDDEKFANSVSVEDTLLGRYTTGAGVIEEITVGSELDISTGSLIINSLHNGVTATTQSAADNSTKVATTAYADAVKGTLVQEVRSTYSTFSTITATIPFDDTIPQNTEGTELMTATITPTNASNILEIDFILPLAWNASASVYGISALFQDSTANALTAAYQHIYYGNALTLRYSMTAGTTSATTFKIRLGAHSGSYPIYVNGSSTGRKFGGVAAAMLTIREVKV